MTDPNTGLSTLVPGAAVIASGGILAIDEFDKCGDTVRCDLHNVMEQGRIDINKSHFHQTLNADVSVLGC